MNEKMMEAPDCIAREPELHQLNARLSETIDRIAKLTEVVAEANNRMFGVAPPTDREANNLAEVAVSGMTGELLYKARIMGDMLTDVEGEAHRLASVV